MPLEVKLSDLVRMGLADAEEAPKKVAQRLQGKKIVESYRAKFGLFMIARKSDGSCVFLQNQRCTIYEQRPEVCRKFPVEIGPRVGFCPYKKV